MKILKQMEERAFEEIEELDNIIDGLVDQANEKKDIRKIIRPQSTSNIPCQPKKEYQVTRKKFNCENR